MDINEILKTEEYRKILAEPVFKDHPIMFVTFGGSHAYGTNIETSDVDIRGCAAASRTDLLGLSNFEQYINNITDTTIYAFPKLLILLMNCNPNVIEMLGCKENTYALVSKEGKLLLDNAHLFLSQRAINSFGGYANQQLSRLKNALARDRMTQGEQEKHILEACERTLKHLDERYTILPEGGIHLYVDESDKSTMDLEIFMDINLPHYPLRDFCSIWRDLNDVSKNYNKLNHRNNKKDDLHLNKHAMHLIRLYMMCIDILENEQIITYREKEHELLMSIRRGDYMDERGLFLPEFYEILDEYLNRFEYAKKNTSLPKSPNYKKLEELAITINERSL